MFLQNFEEIIDLGFRKHTADEWNVGLLSSAASLFWLKSNEYTLLPDSKPAKFIRLFKNKSFVYEDSCRWDKWGMVVSNELYIVCTHHNDIPEPGIKLRVIKEA